MEGFFRPHFTIIFRPKRIFLGTDSILRETQPYTYYYYYKWFFPKGFQNRNRFFRKAKKKNPILIDTYSFWFLSLFGLAYLRSDRLLMPMGNWLSIWMHALCISYVEVCLKVAKNLRLDATLSCVSRALVNLINITWARVNQN